MTNTYAAKRMLRMLPGWAKVSSNPVVDPGFYNPSSGSLFRAYLWDSVLRQFVTEQGGSISLERAADDVVDAIYDKALAIDPAAGEILDYGLKLDSDIGTEWSLTFVIMPLWHDQPTAASAIYPFYHGGGATPKLGYNEQTGVVDASGWYGNTSGTTQSLTYALGWQSGKLIVATLTSSNVAGKAALWVNGVKVATLGQSIKANLSATIRAQRSATQAGVTGKTNLEAYFIHPSALADAQITRLHAMFSTGLAAESRWVRSISAIAMALGEAEDIAWRVDEARNIDQSTGGALTNIAKDYGLMRKVGEIDSSLRFRIKNRLLQYFSQTTVNELLDVVIGVTGLTPGDILLKQNVDATGAPHEAFFTVQIPPGYDSYLPNLDLALTAAKAAGIGHSSGILGTFAWDVDNSGWDTGTWSFLR